MTRGPTCGQVDGVGFGWDAIATHDNFLQANVLTLPLWAFNFGQFDKPRLKFDFLWHFWLGLMAKK